MPQPDPLLALSGPASLPAVLDTGSRRAGRAGSLDFTARSRYSGPEPDRIQQSVGVPARNSPGSDRVGRGIPRFPP